MRQRRVVLAFAAVAVVAIAIALGLGRPWETRRNVSPSAALAALLKQQRYVAVPLRRSKVGSLDVTAQVQGQTLLMYLDSGNTSNMVEKAVGKRLELPSRPAPRGIIALSTTEPPLQISLDPLSLGDLRARVDALLVDQTTTNGYRTEMGEPACNGLLGAPFLKDHAAVIDYGSVQFFLRDRADQAPPAEAVAERARVLHGAGYIELPLTLHASGLPDVTGSFNGQRVLLLVDTGARFSHVDTTVARRLNLPPPKKSNMTESFLDGSQIPLEYTKVEQLALGDVASDFEVVLMDMSTLNAWRKEQGVPAWDGLLAADALEAFAAVVDFGAAKLFLLDPRRQSRSHAGR